MKSKNSKSEPKIHDILGGKIVGISISESEDISKLGYGNAHLIDAKIEIAKFLLSSRITLMYGGDLRKDGFTKMLFELVESYTLDYEDHNYLVNYLGWPIDYTLTDDVQASLSERVRFS